MDEGRCPGDAQQIEDVGSDHVPDGDARAPFDCRLQGHDELGHRRTGIHDGEAHQRGSDAGEQGDATGAARERLGLKSRTALIRRALRLFLDQAGENDVAALLE